MQAVESWRSLPLPSLFICDHIITPANPFVNTFENKCSNYLHFVHYFRIFVQPYTKKVNNLFCTRQKQEGSTRAATRKIVLSFFADGISFAMPSAVSLKGKKNAAGIPLRVPVAFFSSCRCTALAEAGLAICPNILMNPDKQNQNTAMRKYRKSLRYHLCSASHLNQSLLYFVKYF